MLSSRKLLLLWLILTAASCGRVSIKDQAWYVDAGTHGAAEVHTLSTAQADVTKADWDAMRFGMWCTSSQSFKDIKVQLEQLCHATGLCDYETVKAADQFFLKMDMAGARVLP